MIKASIKRRTLFNRGIPKSLPFSDDVLGIMWADSDKTLEPSEFINQVRQSIEQYERVLVIMDRNEKLESGYGPIALVGIHTDGWKVVPDISFFSWSSKRNKLAGAVSLFRMLQQSKEVGITEIRVTEKDINLMKKVKDYGVLRISGKVPFASPDGCEYILSAKGKRAI